MASHDQPSVPQRSTKLRRFTIILICGSSLIGLVVFFRHYWLYHPVGSGPAGPSVDRELFQSTWTDRRVLLVGIGDSVTAGLGASPGSKSYFNRLAANPADEFPEMQGICLSQAIPNLQKLNLARAGTTSIEHLGVLLPDLELQDSATFGLIVITTGGNDIIHNYGRSPAREGAMYGATLEQAQPWIDNFRKRLDTMIDELEARFPGGCCIFLGNIYDPTDGVGSAISAGLPSWPAGSEIHAAYNKIIAECAARRSTVHLVDIHEPFLGHGIYSVQFWRRHYRREDPFYWYWQNFEDPNNRGYDAIRRLFLLEMAKVLPPLFLEMSSNTPDGTRVAVPDL